MSYTFWMVYVVSHSVHVPSLSSPITVYICFTNLTLSQFPEQPTLIQLLETVQFSSVIINILPFLVETL